MSDFKVFEVNEIRLVKFKENIWATRKIGAPARCIIGLYGFSPEETDRILEELDNKAAGTEKVEIPPNWIGELL